MPEPYHHISTDIQDRVLVISVRESQLRDFDTAKRLEHEMKQAVQASQVANVILDLANVIMMTSAALLALLGLRVCVRARSGELVLCNLSDAVAQALTVSQLIVENRNIEAHFKFAEDRPSAFALLQTDV